MNAAETRQAAAVMLAHAEAKEKQGCERPTGFQVRERSGFITAWEELCGSPSWNWLDNEYREKPAPVLKPWANGEGVGRIVREKSDGAISTITAFQPDTLRSHEYYTIATHGPRTAEQLLFEYETWDAATKTSGPCGTLEP